MVTHLVFFKMLAKADNATASENAVKLVERLQELPKTIPQIVELEAGLDFSESPASYEVALLTKFKNPEDLEIYRVHPDHQEVVKFVQMTTSDRAVVDYKTD